MTIWLVMTLTFGLVRLLPGSALNAMRAQMLQSGMAADEVESILASFNAGLSQKPPLQAYIDYIVGIVQGDLGTSITTSIGGNDAVSAIIADALPWTILVMTTATILMFAIGIVLGAIMAYKEGSFFDSSTSTVGIILSSVPFYVLAIVLVAVLSYQLQLFPIRGRLSPEAFRSYEGYGIPFAIDALYHAALPIACVVITGWGVQALAMRGNSVSILGEDYVRVARLRGLSDMRIATRYVARNAVLPMWTGLLTVIGFNLGGSVILEQVFQYPGLGYRMINAINNRDYPLMMGVFLVITTAVVIAIYVADLTYGVVDPRIKTGESDEAY